MESPLSLKRPKPASCLCYDATTPVFAGGYQDVRYTVACPSVWLCGSRLVNRRGIETDLVNLYKPVPSPAGQLLAPRLHDSKRSSLGDKGMQVRRPCDIVAINMNGAERALNVLACPPEYLSKDR